MAASKQEWPFGGESDHKLNIIAVSGEDGNFAHVKPTRLRTVTCNRLGDEKGNCRTIYNGCGWRMLSYNESGVDGRFRSMSYYEYTHYSDVTLISDMCPRLPSWACTSRPVLFGHACAIMM